MICVILSSGYQDIPVNIKQNIWLFCLVLLPTAGQTCVPGLESNKSGLIKWSTMKIQLWVLCFQRLKHLWRNVSPGGHTGPGCSGGLRYYNRGLPIHLRRSRPFRSAASARWCYTRTTGTHVWRVGSPLARCDSTRSLIWKTKYNTGVRAGPCRARLWPWCQTVADLVWVHCVSTPNAGESFPSLDITGWIITVPVRFPWWWEWRAK